MSSNGTTAKIHDDRTHRLVVLGYITAVALPPIGLILGIVLATGRYRSSSKHAMLIIALSIIAGIVWTLVLASGALTSTTNETGY